VTHITPLSNVLVKISSLNIWDSILADDVIVQMSYGCNTADIKEMPYIKWEKVVQAAKKNERVLSTCLGASGKVFS